MNPYLIGIFAFITLAKDLLSSGAKAVGKAINKNSDTKAIALGLGLFVAYRYFKGKENAAAAEQAALTGGSTPESLAARIYQALHPTSWLPSFADGTDETAIKALASQIAQAGNIEAVGAAFLTLYKVDLSQALAADNVLLIWQDAYNAAKTAGSGTGVGVVINNIITKGSKIYIKDNYVIRGNIITSNTYPATSSIRQNNKIWYVNEVKKNYTIAGTTGTWLLISPASGYADYYYVLINGAIKKI